MLINNRIYRELYNFGYKGRQNPYEFWIKKEDEILEHLMNKDVKLIDDRYQLDAFEAKIRWRSPIGTLLAFEIQKRISKYTLNLIDDISEIKVKYGKEMYSIEDFNKLHPLAGANTSGKIDIRGISIIHTDIDTFNFTNVDFSYASINSCICSNLKFSNCIMDYMTISRSEFHTCHFDEKTSMFSVDFSDSLLNSEFECSIEDAMISYLDKKDKFLILIGLDSRWRAFTETLGDSFVSNCSSEKLASYLLDTQRTIAELRKAKNSSLSLRMIAILKLLK